MKNYKVIASWNDGGWNRQTVGSYNTIEQAHNKQHEVMGQLPLSVAEEHVSITIETIKHRKV